MRQIAKINHCETPILGGKGIAVKLAIFWVVSQFPIARLLRAWHTAANAKRELLPNQ
jgi:hypothetical protein